MPKQTQYGNTLFLSDLGNTSPAELLERIQFIKSSNEVQAYDEKWIQNLIMCQPSLLPLDQIEPAFKGIVPICTELPVGTGFVDNIFITPTGDIVLTECKLWRNPEARREVVGQILDYAMQIAHWPYETLEKAIKSAGSIESADKSPVKSLYELVSLSCGGEVDEASFHDAVSRNLGRGRFLLLIVGDGIREGVESLTEFLQQYTGLHFTLSIVEIALYRVPTGGFVAQPRVLAKTANIERGIVKIDGDGQIVFKQSSADARSAKHLEKRSSITQELYFERLERKLAGVSEDLKAFLDKVSERNIVPEFGADTLILRWHSDDGGSWNLATITTTGEVWMDYLGQQARNAGLLELSKRYLERLASLVPDAYVKRTAKETAWNVALAGKSIHIDKLVASDARRQGWKRAIAEFQDAVMRA